MPGATRMRSPDWAAATAEEIVGKFALGTGRSTARAGTARRASRQAPTIRLDRNAEWNSRVEAAWIRNSGYLCPLTFLRSVNEAPGSQHRVGLKTYSQLPSL